MRIRNYFSQFNCADNFHVEFAYANSQKGQELTQHERTKESVRRV